MRALATVIALLIAGFAVTACKSLPGGDGEYATFDRGQNNRGSP